MRKLVVPAALLTGLAMTSTASADTTVQFEVQDGAQGNLTQTAYVKDGMLMLKQAGGDANVDLLFNQADASMTVINHAERSFMVLDEQKLGALADQAQGMMSMVQKQMAEQLANLPPEQAARMREMLGGMGQAPAPAAPPEPVQIVPQGNTTVNGFKCRQYHVLKGGAKISEVCAAEPDELGIPGSDVAVFEAMKQMGERIAERMRGLSESMGSEIPDFSYAEVSGIPVQMRDFSSGAGSSMTVTKVVKGAADVSMQVPQDYAAQQLPSMPQM